MDLAKLIEDNPIKPIWKEYVSESDSEMAEGEESQKPNYPKFLIKPLTTQQADVIQRKSMVKVKSQDGKMKQQQDASKWRRLLVNESLKDWKNLSARKVIELCGRDPESVGVSKEELDAPAIFDMHVAEVMVKNNISLAVFIQNAAMEMAEALTEQADTEKKT